MLPHSDRPAPLTQSQVAARYQMNGPPSDLTALSSLLSAAAATQHGVWGDPRWEPSFKTSLSASMRLSSSLKLNSGRGRGSQRTKPASVGRLERLAAMEEDAMNESGSGTGLYSETAGAPQVSSQGCSRVFIVKSA
jgi:hypothetical protein